MFVKHVSSRSYKHSGPLILSTRKNASTSSSSNFVEVQLDESRLRLETGSLAKMADGSALGSLEGTSVLSTVVCKPKLVSGGFLPLTVDFRHKWAAANRIPMNHLRRDLAPTETEILTARLIDRTLRPLFPRGFGHDVQISCDALSLDPVSGHDPRVAAANAASMALAISDIPWTHGPAAVTRVFASSEDGCPRVNPTRRQAQKALVDVLVGGAPGKRLIMLDGHASEANEELVARCIEVGLDHTEKIIEQILEMKAKIGKKPRDALQLLFLPNEKLATDMTLLAEMKLKAVFDDLTLDKLSRDRAVQMIREEVSTQIRSSCEEKNMPDASSMELAFGATFSRCFRRHFFETGRRPDGRLADELRPISCRSDFLPALHGSSLFQRGQTQVLCTLTLDSMEAALKNDAASVFLGALKEKMFMLTYEFPQFANNEIGFTGMRPNRREIGHAALAERSLRSLMPEDFGFATRLACQVLESNGSSSMASVCAGSLALIDGSVPIKAPCAGVAMGLLTEDDSTSTPKRQSILTDISGLEDYTGDMDFKLAGTPSGLTALQLDVKIPRGLGRDMLREALEKARVARMQILRIMADHVGAQSRPQPKSNRPVVEELVVPVSKRFKMTRMGGYSLRKLESDLGVQITQTDAQTFRIFAPNVDLMREAKESIDGMMEKASDQTKDLEFGAIHSTQVVEILETGVCVTLWAGAEPVFIPNSQLDLRPVRHPESLGITVGSRLLVKYFGRDPVSGHIRLSRKLLLKTANDQASIVEPAEKMKPETDGSSSAWTKIGAASVKKAS